MNKRATLITFLMSFILAFQFMSCSNSEEKKEEKLVIPQNAKLEDENDFYQVFTSVEDCDSVTFTTVWLMDKEDSTVIKVTDPVEVLAAGDIDMGYPCDEWEMEGEMSLNNESRSIMFPWRVNIANNVKHPWKLALSCWGFRHNYSTMIVTEKEPEFKEFCFSEFVCRSKYEDIVFFDRVEDHTDWSYGLVTYIVYDSNMKELRRQLTFLGLCAPEWRQDECKIPEIIERGISMPISTIGDSIRSHKVSVYNEKTRYAEDRKIIETLAENGDIISYLVDEERNKAIKLPVNDEFIHANNIGFVFMSYGTYSNGKRYSVLRIIDEDGNLRYEIK